MARPVTIVTSGAPAYVNVGLSGPPATPVTDGPPIVLVSSGAPPIGLVNDDGSLWSSFTFLSIPAGFTIMGARLLVETHTGPIYRLVRASDSATLDVTPNAITGLPDYTAVATWIGASSAKFDRVYVQDNSGAYAAQTTDANRPIYDASRAVNGCVPICFDGVKASWAVGTPRQKFFDLPTLALNRSSITVALGVAPTISQQDNTFVQLNTSVPSDAYDFATRWASGGLATGVGNTARQNPTRGLIPINPSTVILCNDATSERYYTNIDTDAQTAAARSASSIADGFWGYGEAGLSEHFCGDFFWLALGPSITDAEAKALRASANSIFGCKGPTDWARRIFVMGDSNTEGYNNTGNVTTLTVLQRARASTDLLLGVSLGGESAVSMNAARLTRIEPYVSATLPNVHVVEVCGQDFLNSLTSATVQEYATSLVEWARSLPGSNYMVLHAPTLVNPAYVPGSVITEGTTYSNWINANTVGASAVVVPGLDATLGNSALTADTNYYIDGFHFNSALQTIFAGLMDTAITSALAGAALTKYTFADTDAYNFVGRMTWVPNATKKALIDAFFAGMKTDGIYSKIDRMYAQGIAAIEADSRLEMKGAASLTQTSTVTFTANRGRAGNGTTGYDSIGVGASSLSQLQQNSACVALYINATGSDTSSTTIITMGALNATNGIIITPWRSSGGMGSRLNNVTSTTIGSGVATKLGFSALNRQSSTTVEAFRNGSSIGTAELTSAALASQNILIGAFNNNSTPSGFSTDRVAFSSLGAGLTATEQANFYSRVNTLLTGFGAN